MSTNEKINDLYYELESELRDFENLVEDNETDETLPEYYMDKLKFALEDLKTVLFEIEQFGFGHYDEEGHTV